MFGERCVCPQLKSTEYYFAPYPLFELPLYTPTSPSRKVTAVPSSKFCTGLLVTQRVLKVPVSHKFSHIFINSGRGSRVDGLSLVRAKASASKQGSEEHMLELLVYKLMEDQPPSYRRPGSRNRQHQTARTRMTGMGGDAGRDAEKGGARQKQPNVRRTLRATTATVTSTKTTTRRVLRSGNHLDFMRVRLTWRAQDTPPEQ